MGALKYSPVCQSEDCLKTYHWVKTKTEAAHTLLPEVKRYAKYPMSLHNMAKLVALNPTNQISQSLEKELSFNNYGPQTKIHDPYHAYNVKAALGLLFLQEHNKKENWNIWSLKVSSIDDHESAYG